MQNSTQKIAHSFPSITLRSDAWQAILKQIDGRALTELEKDAIRVAYGRYSAPGYMDCTDWHYSKNKRTLTRELRDMYGEA